MIHRCPPFVRYVVPILLALHGAPSPASGQGSDIGDTAGPVRVIASRTQVRVIFPRDTARTWGWPAEADRSGGGYAWGVFVDGIEGGRSVSLHVLPRDSTARAFPSLAALVASATPVACPPGPFVSCTEIGATASVDHGRVTLTIRGRSMVETLFGLRPRSVRIWRRSPDHGPTSGLESARVEYVSPQIPAPSAARRDSAAAALRRQQADAVSITRTISGGESEWEPLWMAVGDSVPLRINEMRCHYDSCTSGSAALSNSNWSVADTGVVRLRTAPADSVRRMRWRPQAFIVGRREGRTVVRVSGLRGPSDTVLTRKPPQAELEREVVITRPIAHIRISPRIDTVRAGEIREFRVLLTDTEGTVIESAPVDLQVAGGDFPWHTHQNPRRVTFGKVGTWVLSASFAGQRDELRIVVVPLPAAAP